MKKNKSGFTDEEIAAFHSMLYNINTSNHCLNPSFPNWIKGYFENEENEMDERFALSKENERLEELSKYV